jgi:hypothetical protein
MTDSGPGSLRQAIIDANNAPGTATIQFQLPAGPQTIHLLTPLPSVTDPSTLSLDATQNVMIQSPSGSDWGNSSSLTQTGAGTLTFVAGIEGTGDLTVDAGSRLTASHIVQNALVIGGAAGAPAAATIEASAASGNPLTAAAASPTMDATTNSAWPTAPTAVTASAVPIASSVVVMTATTADSSRMPAVNAPTTPGRSGSALAATTNASDSTGLIARKSSIVNFGASSLVNSARDEAKWWPSLVTARVTSNSANAAAPEPQDAVVTRATSDLPRRDAIAAAFDEVALREWLGSTRNVRPWAADSSNESLTDELLAAIGGQWRACSAQSSNRSAL